MAFERLIAFDFHLKPSLKQTVLYCKWFEPKSISSLLSVIVRVSIVLKRTVVVDND